MSNNSTEASQQVIAVMQVFYAVFTFTGIILGLIGSLLTLLVLFGDQSLRSSTRLFQSALALADALVLLTGALRYYFMTAFYLDLREMNSIACRWHTFFTYVTNDVATWTLCALTMERCILITWPTIGYGSSSHNTLLFGILVTGGLLTLAAVKNAVLLWREWHTKELNRRCQYLLHFNLELEIFEGFDLAMTLVIPSILVIASCLGILKVLGRQGGTTSVVSPAEEGNQTVQRQAQLATKVMLVLGVTYLVTSLPGFVYLILSNVPNSPVAQIESASRVDLIYEGFMILQLTANMSRFYVCAMSSGHFRRELRLRVCKRSTNTGE